jgi:hypothetical protein
MSEAQRHTSPAQNFLSGEAEVGIGSHLASIVYLLYRRYLV